MNLLIGCLNIDMTKAVPLNVYRSILLIDVMINDKYSTASSSVLYKSRWTTSEQGAQSSLCEHSN